METISIEEAHMDVKDSIYICTVGIKDPELCKLLAEMKEEERASYVKRALQVGIIALQGMETRMQVDYVRGARARYIRQIWTSIWESTRLRNRRSQSA